MSLSSCPCRPVCLCRCLFDLAYNSRELARLQYFDCWGAWSRQGEVMQNQRMLQLTCEYPFPNSRMIAGQGSASRIKLAAYLGKAYCAGHVHRQVFVGHLSTPAKRQVWQLSKTQTLQLAADAGQSFMQTGAGHNAHSLGNKQASRHAGGCQHAYQYYTNFVWVAFTKLLCSYTCSNVLRITLCCAYLLTATVSYFDLLLK